MNARPTLLTPTPAEGQELARQLARQLLAALPAPASAADHLRTGAAPPSAEIVTAIYFHAIALANQCWAAPAAR